MSWVRLQTTPTTDMRYAFLDRLPCASFFALGRPVEHHFQDGEAAVLEAELGGRELPDFVGNALAVIVVSTRAHAALVDAGLDLGAHDARRCALVWPDGDVLADDYVVLSPHGGRELAHPDTVFRRYTRSQKIYGVPRWVVDAARLTGLPDLVRSIEFTHHYFVSPRFVAAVADAGLTNIEFVQVEIRPARTAAP